MRRNATRAKPSKEVEHNREKKKREREGGEGKREKGRKPTLLRNVRKKIVDWRRLASGSRQILLFASPSLHVTPFVLSSFASSSSSSECQQSVDDPSEVRFSRFSPRQISPWYFSTSRLWKSRRIIRNDSNMIDKKTALPYNDDPLIHIFKKILIIIYQLYRRIFIAYIMKVLFWLNSIN